MPLARALTRAELLALPAAVDLQTAGQALGFGKSKTYELAMSGQFPVPLLRFGRAYRVRTSDLLELLGIEPETSAVHAAAH